MEHNADLLLKFQEWANGRILRALRSSPNENIQALHLLAHILTAEKIWLSRLQGQETVGTDKSPRLSLTECEKLAKENQEGLFQVLNKAASTGIDAMVEYKNLSGKEFSTAVNDILTHVVIHGAHHRGQIVLAIRSAGGEPPNVDFITFVREIK